ncbi:hypothetical protein BKI52_20530 [marine bacterium AO1-C]|nr:hypothetical protein BKI52_20530 [marine bacterium AO1-C]
MLAYRTAQTQDIEYLLWLRKQTMTTYLEQAGIATTDEAHLLRIHYQFENAQVILWKNEPIGLLKLVKGQDIWEIVQFQLAPKNQGQGIGRQVLASVLEAANSNQIPVKLSVLKQNPAKRLYEKMGFKSTHEDEESYYFIYNSEV